MLSAQAAPLNIGMHAHAHNLGTAIRMSLESSHRDDALADHANEELAAGCQVLGLDVVQIPIPPPTPRMSVNLAQRQTVKAPHGTTVPASIAPDLHSCGDRSQYTRVKCFHSGQTADRSGRA